MTITTDEEYEQAVTEQLKVEVSRMLDDMAIAPTPEWEESASKIVFVGCGIPNLDTIIRQLQMDEQLRHLIVEVHEAIDDFSRVKIDRIELPIIPVKLLEIPVAKLPYNYTEKPKRTGKRGFNSARNRVIT